MTLEDLFKAVEEDCGMEYVVRLKYKYDWETQYTYSNVILGNTGRDSFIWSWDWDEGQTDVTVLGYIEDCDIPVCRVVKWLQNGGIEHE